MFLTIDAYIVVPATRLLLRGFGVTGSSQRGESITFRSVAISPAIWITLAVLCRGAVEEPDRVQPAMIE